jgi:predicted transcriptional regulator
MTGRCLTPLQWATAADISLAEAELWSRELVERGLATEQADGSYVLTRKGRALLRAFVECPLDEVEAA